MPRESSASGMKCEIAKSSTAVGLVNSSVCAA